MALVTDQRDCLLILILDSEFVPFSGTIILKQEAGLLMRGPQSLSKVKFCPIQRALIPHPENLHVTIGIPDRSVLFM